MIAAAVDTTLGELLSPSQVNTFLACPAKWYFRYALGLLEPPTGTLALGTAFHSVLAANFRQEIQTKQPLDWALLFGEVDNAHSPSPKTLRRR